MPRCPLCTPRINQPALCPGALPHPWIFKKKTCLGAQEGAPMGHREVTFLPQLVSAHAFAPRDAHKRDDPSAIAPSPALQGPARGLEQVSLSLPIPWHQLGLNFQLLQNKFPGGCTWSWHCAEMPVCLSSAVSVWWGLWGWGSARHAAGCGRLPAAVCGTGIDRGVISLLPRMSAHKCICSNS